MFNLLIERTLPIRAHGVGMVDIYSTLIKMKMFS